MVGTDEELKATEAARAALTTNPNSKETIRVVRQAKYIAALAMTTSPSDKPLNDARHAVVITLSDLGTRLKLIQQRNKRRSSKLEHVPPQLNQGDSRGAKDGRVYRH